MKTRIAIEEVVALRARLAEINSLALVDVEWTKDGKVIDIPAKAIEDFRYIGLCNDNFITMEFYLPYIPPEKSEKPTEPYKTLAERDFEYHNRDTAPDYASTYNSLCTAVASQLRPFHNDALTKSTLRQMDMVIAEVFYRFRASRQLMLIADGLSIVGGSMYQDPHNLSAVRVRWKSAFFPRPRWTQLFGHTVALGFHKHYDLYLAYHDGLPPTLLARYGNLPIEYLSFNLDILREDDTILIEPHFRDAYLRLELLNLDLALQPHD